MALQYQRKEVYGWAGTAHSAADVVVPRSVGDVRDAVLDAGEKGKTVLARGAGCSYGDQALNANNVLLDLREMQAVLEFDIAKGTLHVQSGATFGAVLEHCLPHGWMPACIPGTRYVTLGGALANNVHGKNSYHQGTFGTYVTAFTIVLASGDVYVCSRTEHADLFAAAIGGMGLLGVVTDMTLQLIPATSYVETLTQTAPALDALFAALDGATRVSDFAVAQIDGFARGASLGRGTLYSGGAAKEKITPSVPVGTVSPFLFGFVPKAVIPSIGRMVLTDFTMQLLVTCKYILDRTRRVSRSVQNIYDATFMLDGIPGWRSAYRNGVYEYQAFLPQVEARTAAKALIKLTHQYGMPAYLVGLKAHTADQSVLSYSRDGYSLAFDIPRKPRQAAVQQQLFREMGRIVVNAGGSVYLAKDAVLSPEEFQHMYRNLEAFRAVKHLYDPNTRFQSDLYRRLFI